MNDQTVAHYSQRPVAVGAGEGPAAAGTTSGNEMRAGADAGSPTGLTPGSPPACPHGPNPRPVT